VHLLPNAVYLSACWIGRAKRASHIDPPASSYAIMRRACPYRGENPGPGKDVHGELALGTMVLSRMAENGDLVRLKFGNTSHRVSVTQSQFQERMIQTVEV
jgi:hypothetical protein